MIPEKWQSTIGNIKDKFVVEDEGELYIDEEGGIEIKFIEFEGPLGKMRLEYVSKPLIIDKKTNYSKRIGSETQVEYIYSNSEKTNQLMIYKWSDYDNDWEEMETNMFD
jgi:hypothetical protein